MTDDDLQKMITKHVDLMGEHFDSVQIMATRFDPETRNTKRYIVGNGNWYARFGVTKEWVVMEEEKTRIELRNNSQPPEDDQQEPD